MLDISFRVSKKRFTIKVPLSKEDNIMADNSNNRGFASMDEDKQREIASKGGKASGGSFEKGSQRASEAGKKGAQNEPHEAKVEGGKHSHSGGKQNS